MYNNGLQDNELQHLHKKFKLNLNLFLTDILTGQYNSMFKITDKGDLYEIIPLFYCDSIKTDGDALINGTYSIICRKDYNNIFLFISDNQNVDFDKMYTIKKYEDSNDYLIFIYYLITLEPCRNSVFKVDYGNGNVKQYITDDLGYCTFVSESENFEVII